MLPIYRFAKCTTKHRQNHKFDFVFESSQENELKAVPRVNEPEIQTKNECPISSVSIVAKKKQGISRKAAKNCPISSVPIKEKGQDTSQNNSESCPISSIPIVERTKISQNKEGELEATGLGTTSVEAERKSEEVKTSEPIRQE